MKPAAIILLTPASLEPARRLQEALPGTQVHGGCTRFQAAEVDRLFDDLGPHLRELFERGTPLLAFCAAGILIRTLAPALADKRAEPPVVAIAPDGSVAVPLLGGHRGANALARKIASLFGGTAAVTTAGDVHLGLALDEPPAGWTLRNPEAARPFMAALLAGEPVALTVEAGDAGWLQATGIALDRCAGREILVTDRDQEGGERRLVYHPKVLALGVGCERGTDPHELIGLFETMLARFGLARDAIGCVVSVDLKAAEPAVHALAESLDVPARFFDATELELEAPRLANPSPAVFAETGCHGVAEGAALAAAGPQGDLIVPKTKLRRATCAIARAPAPLDPEQIGRPQGRLALIGLGPGTAAWRTPEADALLADAEEVIGYRGYLDLLDRPAHSRQRRTGFALGEEEARCRHALGLAAQGRRVALVSSGDIGIYGMAALVFELLERSEDPRWQRVAITVSPGISALSAAAARAGAPLGHDFCTISLSDLLTPWPEIQRRLQAAAEGDFVTVLYNPASSRRRAGLNEAVSLLRAARSPETPVVHARNLGRAGERVEVTTLQAFAPDDVDMLSLIIVGSSRTRLAPRLHSAPFVYTPRGYFADERNPCR